MKSKNVIDSNAIRAIGFNNKLEDIIVLGRLLAKIESASTVIQRDEIKNPYAYKKTLKEYAKSMNLKGRDIAKRCGFKHTVQLYACWKHSPNSIKKLSLGFGIPETEIIDMLIEGLNRLKKKAK